MERYVVPKGPAAVPVFDISDFPMTLPGLPSSIASSPATTLAPETPRIPLPSVSSQPKPSQKHHQERRCRLRLTQSCEKLRRRELRGQPTNSSSMMQCCPPSSSQSLRTQFQISGYERMFHYCLMTVMRRRMLFEASCHNLSPAGIENMYPSAIDKKHREWSKSLMSPPLGDHKMLQIS